VALVAASCGDDQKSEGSQAGDSESGVVTAAILNAPADAKCIVITVMGTTTVTKQYTVAAAQNSTFNLTGLPVGNATFSAVAYNVPCAGIGGSPVTYVSDPYPTFITAYPTAVTLQMRPASGATGTVSVSFPTPPGTIAEFTIPTAGAYPWFITSGPDGNLWFSEWYAKKIGQITPWGSITEFAMPSGSGFPDGITTGPDGNIWFAEAEVNKIGRLQIATGTINEYAIPSGGAANQITSGPDGRVWFTEPVAQRIGAMRSSGAVTEYTLAGGRSPQGIVGGPDGNVWFTLNSHTEIGRITPAGTVTYFAISNTGDTIAVGADGNLWFTEGFYIGKMTTGGTLTEYSSPSVGSGAITPGNDGMMWFTEQGTGPGGTPLGSITTSGVTATTIYAAATADKLAAGSDGSLWVTEGSANKVARIKP